MKNARCNQFRGARAPRQKALGTLERPGTTHIVPVSREAHDTAGEAPALPNHFVSLF